MKKQLIILSLILPLVFSGCSFSKSKTSQPAASNSEQTTQKTTQPNNVENKDNPGTNKTSSEKDDSNKTGGSSTSPNKMPNIDSKKDTVLQPEKEKSKPIILPQVNISELDTTEKSWFFVPKNDGTPSGEPPEVLKVINKYSAYYLGDTSKKELYLTFDEGYENGYTGSILDTLKKNDVKAAFFVVQPYITSSKNLVKRMSDEGHLVVNHSVNHPSMATIKDQTKFISELSGVEKAFEEVTGKKLGKFFRPPMGKYSDLSLYYTAAYGYRTIFWSFAYEDWDPAKQPAPDGAKKLILQRTHNGAIILLHAVSKTNAEILDDLIKEWKARGYEFKSLEDLP